MNLPKLSITRPVFATCVTLALLVVGWVSYKSMPLEFFPEVAVPVVSVQTVYPGAGPAEIETLVSRPIEDEVSTIAGIKRMTSKSYESISMVIVEFNSEVDIKQAEQEVRDKINQVRGDLPDEAEDSIIKRFDPSDTPIMLVGVSSDVLGPAQLFDAADQYVKPRLEQVRNIGQIDILGGREREIQVVLDRRKLKAREISVNQVAAKVSMSGQNIPSGKVNRGEAELSFRGLGEFQNVEEVEDTLVNLFGNEVPTSVKDVGSVVDTIQDEKSRAYLRDQKMLALQIYRQSGANIVNVVDDVKAALVKMQPDLDRIEGNIKVQVLTDSSIAIKKNVYEVLETIIIGIILTVITVFFFLASPRATLITSMSLPISLIGAFALMKLSGFSLNIISLLALTLAVGLLIDDAIVVVENIYRRMELGEDSLTAADRGTNEIQLSVLAITLVVIAVFIPVGTMKGTIGQFLSQFGLTIVFSMAVSWYVAMSVMPMLTAYFGGKGHSHAHKDHNKKKGIYDLTLGRLVDYFDKFQTWLENKYEALLKVSLEWPKMTILLTLVVFAMSLVSVTKVKGTFIRDDNAGEFSVTLELPPGASLDGTEKIAKEVYDTLLAYKEVDYATMLIGNTFSESNKAQFYVRLKPNKERGGITTEDFRVIVRKDLEKYSDANPVVKKYDASGGMGQQPFVLNLISTDPAQLETAANKILEEIKKDPRFKDVQTNSRPGKPEMQVNLKPGAAKEYGINTTTLGSELRAQVEGVIAAKFREKGREYDVRVRLQDDQRDLLETFKTAYVPNINNKLVRLTDIATGDKTLGPATIERMDRARYIQITADTGQGVSITELITDVTKMMTEGELALPSSVRYGWSGQAENMGDLMGSTILALALAILFIYLILSSLYESFITPITIMVALPLALSGAFFALFLTNNMFTLFAIFGFFMLIGVAGKNGILLVDYANQRMAEGVDRKQAIIIAGKTRLRPILMTSFALIAGTLPLAIGLSEASASRTEMGTGIIGGMLFSTVLTLIVVPAIFWYVDRFRVWANNLGSVFTTHDK